MASNIRPSGVFDTSYEKDIALNRTRADKVWKYGAFIALLLLPLVTEAGPFGLPPSSLNYGLGLLFGFLFLQLLCKA